MKTLILLLFITACSHCPDRIYRQCIASHTEMYMDSLGRGHALMLHREVCDQYGEVRVSYNCKTYKLGEECKDND